MTHTQHTFCSSSSVLYPSNRKNCCRGSLSNVTYNNTYKYTVKVLIIAPSKNKIQFQEVLPIELEKILSLPGGAIIRRALSN